MKENNKLNNILVIGMTIIIIIATLLYFFYFGKELKNDKDKDIKDNNDNTVEELDNSENFSQELKNDLNKMIDSLGVDVVFLGEDTTIDYVNKGFINVYGSRLNHFSFQNILWYYVNSGNSLGNVSSDVNEVCGYGAGYCSSISVNDARSYSKKLFNIDFDYFSNEIIGINDGNYYFSVSSWEKKDQNFIKDVALYSDDDDIHYIKNYSVDNNDLVNLEFVFKKDEEDSYYVYSVSNYDNVVVSGEVLNNLDKMISSLYIGEIYDYSNRMSYLEYIGKDGKLDFANDDSIKNIMARMVIMYYVNDGNDLISYSKKDIKECGISEGCSAISIKDANDYSKKLFNKKFDELIYNKEFKIKDDNYYWVNTAYESIDCHLVENLSISIDFHNRINYVKTYGKNDIFGKIYEVNYVFELNDNNEYYLSMVERG